MSGRRCVLTIITRLPLTRYCSNGPCAFVERILVKQKGKHSYTWMPWEPLHESSPLQTITPINTTGTLLSTKPLAPNFIRHYYHRVRKSKPCRRYMITGSSLFYTGTKSVQTDGSTEKLCTLQPTASPHGCLKVRVQWEETTGEAAQ